MIDYLYRFDTQEAALLALPKYHQDNQWDTSRVLTVQLGVAWVDGPAGDDGEASKVPVYASGYWLVVSTAAPDDTLWSIPECMREADRDAADRGEPFVLRDRFTPEQLAVPYWVTPVWTGSMYPFIDNANAT